MLTAFNLSERQTFCWYRGERQRSKLFAIRDPQLQCSPTPTGFTEIVGNDPFAKTATYRDCAAVLAQDDYILDTGGCLGKLGT